MKYKVTLTTNQMRILVNALDSYSRIEMGQIETAIMNSPFFYQDVTEKFSHEDFDNAVNNLKKVLGHAPNSSYGIYSEEISQSAREAYAIQCVLRHQLWKDYPPDKRSNYTVDADDHIMNHNEPKVIVEKED